MSIHKICVYANIAIKAGSVQTPIERCLLPFESLYKTGMSSEEGEVPRQVRQGKAGKSASNGVHEEGEMGNIQRN